jgi:hypothetical protein
MIRLVKFTLKHPEPLINKFGTEQAESIEISKKTIEALRKED